MCRFLASRTAELYGGKNVAFKFGDLRMESLLSDMGGLIF
jgi:hypothetical protein